MKDQMFNELVESIREAGAILRGEIAPSRVIRITVNVEKTSDTGVIRNEVDPSIKPGTDHRENDQMESS